MSEFKYRLKFSFRNSKITDKNSQIIRYKFSRAIGHFLGIQKYSKFLKLLDFVSFYVDQHFINQKINYKLKMIDNNCLTDYFISNPKLYFRSRCRCRLGLAFGVSLVRVRAALVCVCRFHVGAPLVGSEASEARC